MFLSENYFSKRLLIIIVCIVNQIYIVRGYYESMKEMRFKYWLQPNAEECYHEVLDAGATLYFMYEILNADTHDSSIVSYVRHKNGTILSVATTPQRGHLEVKLDDTNLVDICMSNTHFETYAAKYMSVFFHIYHIDKIIESMKEIEKFDNSSLESMRAIDSIASHIMVSRQSQIEIEMLAQKDSYLIEMNYRWVQYWALIHLGLIIGCNGLQTLFIKRLFKTNNRSRMS